MIEPKMKWLYCSGCNWHDEGPNIHQGTRCPECGDLLVIFEGILTDILEIYDEIKINGQSLQEYLKNNNIRWLEKKENYIL